MYFPEMAVARMPRSKSFRTEHARKLQVKVQRLNVLLEVGLLYGDLATHGALPVLGGHLETHLCYLIIQV